MFLFVPGTISEAGYNSSRRPCWSCWGVASSRCVGYGPRLLLAILVYAGCEVVLTAEQQELIEELIRKGYRPPDKVMEQAKIAAMTIEEFATNSFYIPETGKPIVLEPHQLAILNYALDKSKEFVIIIFSAIKKSGKTAVAGLVARYIAETYGFKQECYCLANDEEQARGRIYQAIVNSIELDPHYDKKKRILYDAKGNERWKVIEEQLVHLPSGSTIKAINSDYRGAAGSNPTATFFSELWGWTKEKDRKLWAELTPPPTRDNAIRFVETYAGYTGESTILEELWNQALEGRRLTKEELQGWSFEDQPPCYVHDRSRMFAYLDTGADNTLKGQLTPRRMPWQIGEKGDAYYQQQANDPSLTVSDYDRLHRNLWQLNRQAFIPIQWFYDCYDPTLPPLEEGSREFAVMAIDASMTSDCTALCIVTRHPNDRSRPALRYYKKWDPKESGGVVSYRGEGNLEDEIRQCHKRWNIVEATYDNYQIHDLMTQLSEEGAINASPFSQGADRMEADKHLYDVLRDKRLAHRDTNGSIETDMSQHLKNCAAEYNVKQGTKLRIVKSGTNTSAGKIDLAVVLSMGTHRLMEYMI